MDISAAIFRCGITVGAALTSGSLAYAARSDVSAVAGVVILSAFIFGALALAKDTS